MRTTVVGRVDEMALVRELARRAATGHGATVLVEGEPGIGKSMLLAAAAAEGRRLGARVLRGAGTPQPSPPPFAAIRPWLETEPPIQPAETGSAAAVPDLLITELVLDRLQAWCGTGPLVVLVDDLQWADPSSLLLLGRLGRSVSQLPLLLVAAYQPAPRDPRLDVLLRSLLGRGAVSITLAPLAGEDLAALVQSLLGAPPSDRLRRLLARAGGNPLYATEVLGALARTGRIQVVDGVATLRGGTPAAMSGTLLDLIRGRLTAMSPAALDLLRTAAVLSPGFDLTELAAVLGAPVISLWQPVSEAVAAGLLVDAGDELVFRHDLIRQALSDDLPAAEAEELRLRAGRALAAAGARVEQVARHLTAASGLTPDLVEWLTRSAEALIVRAPELAAPLIERALTQRPGEAPEILRLQYARALLWSGRPAEAQRAVQAALSAEPAGDLLSAEPAGDLLSAEPTGTALPAAPSSTALHWLLAQAYLQNGRVGRARSVAERVLAGDRCGEDEAAGFHGLVAQCLLLSGRFEAADQAAVRALTGADDYGTACALTVRSAVRLLRQHPAEALDLADRALTALGSGQVQPDRPFAPHLVRGFGLLELGRFSEADAAFAEGRTHDGRGSRALLTWHRMGGALVRYLDGRWDDALAEIRSGLDAADGVGVTEALHSLGALIALHRGDRESYAAVRDHRDPNPYWGWLRLSAQALHAEHDGDPEKGLLTLLDAWERGWLGSSLAAELARLAACTGRLSQAAAAADVFDRVAAHHPGPQIRATALLCRGVAEADPALLLRAGQAFGTAGRPLYEGYAYEEAAGLLAAVGPPARARAALDSAVGCYARLGATWDIDRAQARLRVAGVRQRNVRQRPKSGWEALTETERKVLALVVAGRSNPDIAAELYLSRRTVRNHVSHILAKVGLSSRVELAVSAYERDSQ
jgi:DNA-binding CsgD family transcriptional regulator/tetratricopeptide (TPR) repeat protein